MLEEARDTGEIIELVAALDIGKAELVCCVRVPDAGKPGRRLQEISTRSTMTRSLLFMADRLRAMGVTRVVMEATSVHRKRRSTCWKRRDFEVWLVNANDESIYPGGPKRQARRRMAVQDRGTANAPAQFRPLTAEPPAAGT